MENQPIAPNQIQNSQAPAATPSSGVTSPSPMPDISAPKTKYGRLSLIFSVLAVGVFILLVFATGLIDSLAKAYMWFFIILALGIAGLATGIISEKGQEKLSLTGLLGIILSVIVCVNCLVIGSYYIKIQMALNDFKVQFNDTSSNNNNSTIQDFQYNYPTQ